MHALFVDNLTVIDFAYFDPKRGIVGESLILDVELFGELNDEGMLFDFSFVKKRIKACVDDLADHKFVIPANHQSVRKYTEDDSLCFELKTESSGTIIHKSPPQAVFLLDADSVSVDSLRQDITRAIRLVVPDNVSRVNIVLRPEEIEGSYYHYAHGLKKHFGDCQRIAHGHRSKIEVEIDGQRVKEAEENIAREWRDIYLATEEDIAEKLEIDGKSFYRFAYEANQGQFELTLQASRCEIIQTDTTVELIADHLCRQLQQKYPDQDIRIKAFEGVDKGAIAWARS